MPDRILISPLCHRTLGKALKLLHEAFPQPPLVEHPAIALPYSLIPSSIKLALSPLFQVTALQYWVARQPQTAAVIGVIGLYGWRSQPSTLWLGWFCVDSNWQRQGVGSELLHWAIDKAQKLGKSHLQVYTPSNADQALNLYRDFGFKVVKTRESSINLELALV